MAESNEQNKFPTISSPDSSTVIDEQIGPYKLLSIIGEGGFGIVYLAEQKTPIKRQVALKIIKPGMDSKQVIARFEAESQALALLDHPNIAYVLGAGTTESGRPYFAMEYIKGIPITEYCDREKLSIEDRLKLFIQVCEAVQCAHQKGIIHRDIKPSNIMVSVQDNKAIPKIIDFGVAKAIGMPLTEKTLFTQQGQLIGTPAYMSPEQADMKERDIDTRTDIYSLGIVLYELLTGALPFEPETLREAGFAEIQRIIREQEPARPSTKLSSLGEEGSKVAQSRQTELARLVKSLHQELDWIPMKAIRKEREQRYKTASEFTEDIVNYLEGNPLIAGPESGTYRLKKFVRRNRAMVIGVAVVLITLIAGIIASTIFAVREKEQRKLAEVQRNRAEQEKEAARQTLYCNRIALIDAEYQQSNIANVQKLLQLCPKDMRGWEYDRLQYISDQAEITLRGHEGPVKSVVFSPDGKRIISGGDDNTIRVWDVSTGVNLMTLRGHNNRVWSVAISPDGKWIASASFDRTIKLWDAETGAELHTLRGHGDSVISVSFSPDGERIASSAADGTIRIWNVNSGNELLSINEPGAYVFSVDFSPDGTKLVSCSTSRDEEKSVKLWDSQQGELLRKVSRAHMDNWGVSNLCQAGFNNDGTRIFLVAWGQVWILDAETLEIEVAIPKAHTGNLKAVFSPDGKQIVSAGIYGELKIWNATNGLHLRTLRGHIDCINGVAFSPDGSRIVSASEDGTIKLWDTYRWRDDIILIAHPNNPIHAVAFSPNGTRLVSGSTDRQLKIWDTRTWRELRTLRGHTDTVASVAFSPDGRYIVSGSHDSSIRIWDAVLARPFPVLTIKGHSGRVNSVKYKPDGKEIVSGGDDRLIKVWDKSSGGLSLSVAGHTDRVLSVCYSPGGEKIISGSADKTVRVWDAQTGEALMMLTGHKSKISSVASSPDGKKIASGDEAGVIILWDSETGDHLSTLEGHRGGITEVVFSPDGSRILSGSADYTARLWDVTTGIALLTLQAYDVGEINALAFSPNGKTVTAGASWWGKMVIWDSAGPEQGMATRSAFNFHTDTIPIKYAIEACEMTNWKDWFYLGILAAAYSEVGHFNEAVEWQKKAVDLMPEDYHNRWMSNYETRLMRYKSRKNWHFSPGEMVAWWKFDEIQVGNIVDSSGNAYNLNILGGATLATGKYGAALQLDGVDDHAEVGVLGLDANNLTITAWIKRNGEQAGSYTGIVFCRDGYTTAGLSFGKGEVFDDINHELAYNWNDDPNTWNWHSGLFVPNNEWVFVALVVQPTQASLYLYKDGKLHSATNTVNHSIEEFDGVTRIGSDPLYKDRYFAGTIDEVRIYSFALSEAEIKALYAGKEIPLRKE